MIDYCWRAADVHAAAFWTSRDLSRKNVQGEQEAHIEIVCVPDYAAYTATNWGEKLR